MEVGDSIKVTLKNRAKLMCSMHPMRTDTIQLTPMGMSTADMVADNPGTRLFHCHKNDHFEGGTVALYTVLP